MRLGSVAFLELKDDGGPMLRLLGPCLLATLVCWSGSPSAAPKPRESIESPTSARQHEYGSDDLESELRRDPVACLGRILREYRAEVRSESFTCIKQERLGGRLEAEERIDVLVREQPYAVRMLWRDGARSVAGSQVRGLLYTAGENRGRMTVWRPEALVTFLRFHDLSPTDSAARQSSRYSPTEASLGHTLERTHRSWSSAKTAGKLEFDHLGKQTIAKCGNKLCFVLKRTCREPECDPFLLEEALTTSADDGAKFITIFLDAADGRQVGAELLRADGVLMGHYYFNSIVWNPKLGSKEFTRSGF